MEFAIEHRDAGSQARAGVLHLAHGEVRTPAFVPLATKGTVKTLLPAEVAALGYDMVLGNTFHLMLEPGPEVVAAHGGLHGFMGWPGPIITDSGGFQVFSMGHGTVADEIKGRASQGAEREGAILAIEEEGVRFRSYIDGAERFLSPEGSMEVQAALGSDIALAFDECTPFHVSRDYTAASTERTHRWLRPLPGLARRARPAPARPSTGSSRAASTRTCAAVGARRWPPAAATGIAIGGSLGQDKAQMHEVVGLGDCEELPGGPSAPPARDRRDRRPDPRRRAGDRHVRLRDAHAARAATGWRWCPSRRPAGASTCQRPLPRRPRADPRRLLLPGVRGRLFARLPAPPRPRSAS